MPTSTPTFPSFPSLSHPQSIQRKRILDDSQPTVTKRTKTRLSLGAGSFSLSLPLIPEFAVYNVQRDVMARLVAKDESDVSHVTLGNPTTVGRGAQCNYVIKDPVVSSIHFRLYAVKTSEGGIMVSCEDLSSNGLVWNNHRIRRAAIILHHGDVLQIPGSQVFQVEMDKRTRGKAMPFDPTPPQRPLERVIGGYTITSHTLGSGHFATVHLGFDAVRQRQVACKTIKTTKTAEIMKEFKILGTLNHPNINRVLGMVDEEPWTHILLELSTGGDLFTYITAQGMLIEGEAKFLGYQLILGLVYMHELNVSHRDLKPENILIYAPRAYPRVQIADFGLARDRSHEPAFSIVGTIEYLPPEAVVAFAGHAYRDRRGNGLKRGYDGKKVDCWSLGVILYTMLCGTHPFDFNAESQRLTEGASQPTISQGSLSQQSDAGAALVCDRILDGTVNFGFSPWPSMRDAKHIIRKLLVHEPERRLSAYGAMQHSWVQTDLLRLEELYREVTK